MDYLTLALVVVMVFLIADHKVKIRELKNDINLFEKKFDVMDKFVSNLNSLQINIDNDLRKSIEIEEGRIDLLRTEIDTVYAVVNENSRIISKLNEKGVENND